MKTLVVFYVDMYSYFVWWRGEGIQENCEKPAHKLLVKLIVGEVRLEVGGRYQNFASSLCPLPSSSSFLGSFQATGTVQ
jgi:hypothetical protein